VKYLTKVYYEIYKQPPVKVVCMHM